MQLDILYEDKDLVIVNKPAGLLVIPDRFNRELPSLNKLLEQHYGKQVFVVHRIDRDTSGVICFAKHEESHKYLSKLFQEHEVGKYYLGLVHGRLIPTEGRIEKPIVEHPAKNGKMVTAKKGKPSITDYKVVEEWPLHSLVQFQIHTGRTHQIRVHTQSIGHSIVADPLYGDGKPFFLSSIKKKYRLSDNDEAERPLLSRLALHASRLELKKEDGTEIVAEAPLPKDIAACVKQLNKWSKV
ncbi:RluA family pseudouridine synthase [Polluticoccus soli]|uniref:RluA family pseudouridine synthase n=1 Tax=Polluticoccus soli TaxID=3034150 RepID=UPI0023E0D96A|nr:RluA family pseudouridine synthase [Flavipsychrobacter sp. JY13-12]